MGSVSQSVWEVIRSPTVETFHTRAVPRIVYIGLAGYALTQALTQIARGVACPFVHVKKRKRIKVKVWVSFRSLKPSSSSLWSRVSWEKIDGECRWND